MNVTSLAHGRLRRLATFLRTCRSRWSKGSAWGIDLAAACRDLDLELIPVEGTYRRLKRAAILSPARDALFVDQEACAFAIRNQLAGILACLLIRSAWGEDGIRRFYRPLAKRYAAALLDVDHMAVAAVLRDGGNLVAMKKEHPFVCLSSLALCASALGARLLVHGDGRQPLWLPDQCFPAGTETPQPVLDLGAAAARLLSEQPEPVVTAAAGGVTIIAYRNYCGSTDCYGQRTLVLVDPSVMQFPHLSELKWQFDSVVVPPASRGAFRALPDAHLWPRAVL